MNSPVNPGPEQDCKTVQIGPKTFQIPKNWGIETVPNLCNLETKSFDVSSHENDTFEYIDIESVSQGSIDTSKTIPVEEAPSRAKQIVEVGDTLVGKVRPYLQAFAPVTKKYDGVVCSTGFAVLSAKEDVSASYITQAVLSKYFLDQMTNRMTGTSYPAVNKSDFENVKLFTPTLPEQRRIADILSTVDEQIQQTDEIIEVTKKLKRGLTQDLLLGHDVTDKQEIQIGPKSVRIPSTWETANLGDVGRNGEKSFVDGDWVESDDMVEEGEYQLIQLGNIGIGKFKGECDKFVSEEFFEKKDCTLVEKGDILISRLADPVLRTIEVPEFEKKSITAVDIVVAKVDELSWDKRYLKFLLNSKVMSDVGEALATGSTRQRISRKNMEGITIPKPPQETQIEIADVLEMAQVRIQQETEHKQHLQDLKRGLMQDLLTGDVRVDASTSD